MTELATIFKSLGVGGTIIVLLSFIAMVSVPVILQNMVSYFIDKWSKRDSRVDSTERKTFDTLLSLAKKDGAHVDTEMVRIYHGHLDGMLADIIKTLRRIDEQISQNNVIHEGRHQQFDEQIRGVRDTLCDLVDIFLRFFQAPRKPGEE